MDAAWGRSRDDRRPPAPAIDPDITFATLPREIKGGLRSLSKQNAERVGAHLAMAGRYLEQDAELAYTHAKTAARTAGRIDVAREAVALTAYATGRYAEAVREIRTVRRLAGEDLYRSLEADSERGLGRPERALDIVAEARRTRRSTEEQVELVLVESGARADLGEHDAGLLVVENALARVSEPALVSRLQSVRADRLEELGRVDEAERLRQEYPQEPEPEDDPSAELVVFDLGDDVERIDPPADDAADAPDDSQEEAATSQDAPHDGDGGPDGVLRQDRDGDEPPRRQAEPGS